MKIFKLLFVLLLPIYTVAQINYEKEWAEIDSLEKDGLPRQALEKTHQIFLQATENGLTTQIIKSTIYELKYNDAINENEYILAIHQLKKQITKSEGIEKPLLQSLLAEVYFGFYERNKWAFNDRTQLEVNPDSSDLNTWTKKDIIEEVVYYFNQSVLIDSSLKNTPVDSYPELIINYEEVQTYQPTMYDFLMHRAIRFFTNNDVQLDGSDQVFYLKSPQYFDDNLSFSQLDIPNHDSLNFNYLSIDLYQKLTQFHINTKNQSALLMLEKERLKFVYNHSVLHKNGDYYNKALLRLANTYPNNSLSAQVWFELAKVIKNQPYDPRDEKSQWNKKLAKSICVETLKKYPNATAKNNLNYLIQDIERKDMSFTMEETLLPKMSSKLLLEYQNVDSLYLKIVAVNSDKFVKLRENEKFEFLKKQQGVYTQTIRLKNVGDYRNHSTEIEIPALNHGDYVIVISSSKYFEPKSNGYNYNHFQVSSLTAQSSQDKDVFKLVVRNRKTGTPIQHAKVKIQSKYYDYNKRKYVETNLGSQFTNELGYIELKNQNKYISLILDIEYQEQHLRIYKHAYSYRDNKPQTETKVSLFTDRKLYRPGQTVYFKGICYEKEGVNRELKTNYTAKVYFKDVNYQIIDTLFLTTNQYGSFSGEFKIPTGMLGGQMSLNTKGGNTYFRVEEYKRPKFSVEFKPIEDEYKLTDSIDVTGFATALSGYAIDGAKVTYTVTRNSETYSWRYFQNQKTTTVAVGEAYTNEKGEFLIRFKANPDLNYSKDDLPIFRYTINAQVSDINGETHSASSSLRVGYHSLELSQNIPDQMEREKTTYFNLFTQNLNGQHIPASGKLTIYALKTPAQTFRRTYWENPDFSMFSESEFHAKFPLDAYQNEDSYEQWEVEKTILSTTFNTHVTDSISIPWSKSIKNGIYKYVATSKDKNGVEVTDIKYFEVFDSKNQTVEVNEVFSVIPLKKDGQPGEKAQFLLQTAEKQLSVYVTVKDHHGIVKEEWIDLSKEQKMYEIPITETQRGNFWVEFSAVKNNRYYSEDKTIYVPYKNKELNVAFSTFRNKLLPGQAEEWIVTIKNPKGQAEAAELLATLYDASLDELYQKNSYFLSVFDSYYSFHSLSAPNEMSSENAREQQRDWNPNINFESLTEGSLNYFGYSPYYQFYFRNDILYDYSSESGNGSGFRETKKVMSNDVGESAPVVETIEEESADEEEIDDVRADKDAVNDSKPLEKNEPIQIRTNFNETAFFYPQLLTDKEGNISIKFTIPESITKWRFLALAHTKDLKSGTLNAEVFTQKPLMVVPNTPRFLREGDAIYLSAKIRNQSDKEINTNIRLELFNPFNDNNVSADFKLENSQQNIQIKSHASQVIQWKIEVPEGVEMVKYRFVAQSDEFSDGEENVLPILSNRMLVTESLPISMRGTGSKTFHFKSLEDSDKSNSIAHQNLTLEYTSNPVWYVVQAMPYMMEYPHECAEQLFSRYYANALATHLMNSNPKIKTVINQWADSEPDELWSNLQKNTELKQLLLEETPWVIQAQNEEAAKKNLALLLDLNRMNNELNVTLKKITDAQNSNGSWAWFPGMRPNRYITQHIVSGFGHLNHLGVQNQFTQNEQQRMIKKAIQYLDAQLLYDFNQAKKYDKNYLKNQHLHEFQVQYLYARSFFTDVSISKQNKIAFDYYHQQAKTYWKNFHLYSQGMMALAAYREGDEDFANKILASIKDRAIHHDEYGMYWKTYTENNYYWYQAPIETQALMIELFNEVAQDQNCVDELKIWLLKEKQTTHWKTTKQTTEAVYALLLNGSDWLEEESLAEIQVGGQTIEYVNQPTHPYQVKANNGTGYFKTQWKPNEIQSKMGEVKVTQNKNGISWGAMYWQYFEDLDQIKQHNTGLSVTKEVYKVASTPQGEELISVSKNPLKVGDRLRVRLVIKTDRNLEYVHLKDGRGAGLEPVSVLSTYRYQGGLGYYQTTKDAATHFFFDDMAKGTYVFEYDLNVEHQGEFSNGIAEIQCLYAPEFRAHSKGVSLKVH